MTGLRVMPPPEGENDAGGRFTDDPGRDSQRHGSRFLCGCCGYAWCCPVGGDAPDALTGTGATPRPEGLVRARGRVRFHTRPPALLGSLPIQESLGGKAIERRSERGGSTKRSGLRASTLTSRQSRLRSSPIDHGNQSDRSSGGRSPWCADAVWPARDVNTTARPNGHTVTTCPRTNVSRACL